MKTETETLRINFRTT